ncbi:MAG: metal-sensitive transcriptional regulator, partial [Actinomycetota bacterium]
MLKDVHQRAVLNRLKTARGHLDAIIRMVEGDTYCPDLMK